MRVNSFLLQDPLYSKTWHQAFIFARRPSDEPLHRLLEREVADLHRDHTGRYGANRHSSQRRDPRHMDPVNLTPVLRPSRSALRKLYLDF